MAASKQTTRRGSGHEPQPSSTSNQQAGIYLLNTDDTPDTEEYVEPVLDDTDDDGDFEDDLELELVDETALHRKLITPAARRQIIVDRCTGLTYEEIGIRNGVSPQAAAKIYKKFVKDTANERALSDENPEVFRKKVRKMAVNALVSGLTCARNPYQQGALGLQTMKGIGEFQGEGGHNTQINILIQQVPEEWKQRYVGNSRMLRGSNAIEGGEGG